MGLNTKPVIVVLGFNREKSLSRLLKSLANAKFQDKVKLIISLDGGAAQEVIKLANGFECKNLDIEVIIRNQRLGLRNHVIACGDLTEKFGSVIILEDDLLVDKYFYHYANEAVKFYEKIDCLAGISLYQYEYNELANLPFNSMWNGFDTYFMQIPSSSGQVWTQNQWKLFKEWYQSKTERDLIKIKGLPDPVKKWPESSWKKYFHAYIVQCDKYFVYPYRTYSTNCSDEGGEHVKSATFRFQSSLSNQNRLIPSFNFTPIDNREVIYDSFMEPKGDFIWRTLGKNESEVEIDFQGLKPLKILKQKKYSITSKPAYRVISKFPLAFRPIEMNMVYPNEINSNNFLRLVFSSDLIKENRIKRSITWYSYHSKFNISSLSFFRDNFFEIIKVSFENFHKIIFKK